jgi:hypothetical protein
MKFDDRVKETTTTTGTAALTLDGPDFSFNPFSSSYSIGEPIPYSIVGSGTSEWEVGIGRLTSSSVLAREIITRSSNGNNLTNFSAGTKTVFCTIPAYTMSRLESMGHTLAKSLGYDMP